MEYSWLAFHKNDISGRQEEPAIRSLAAGAHPDGAAAVVSPAKHEVRGGSYVFFPVLNLYIYIYLIINFPMILPWFSTLPHDFSMFFSIKTSLWDGCYDMFPGFSRERSYDFPIFNSHSSARSTSSSVGALAGVWGGLALILRQLIRWVRIPFKSTVFRWFYPLVN